MHPNKPRMDGGQRAQAEITWRLFLRELIDEKFIAAHPGLYRKATGGRSERKVRGGTVEPTERNQRLPFGSLQAGQAVLLSRRDSEAAPPSWAEPWPPNSCQCGPIGNSVFAEAVS